MSSATQLLSYSATQLLSYSATQLLSYSATQLLSYSATQLLSLVSQTGSNPSHFVTGIAGHHHPARLKDSRNPGHDV
jgi:hypothetical protein